MTEEEEIKYIKEYLHSNYSDEHLIQIGASEDDINYIKTETFQLKDKLSKQMGNLVISNEVFSFILQAYIDCEKNENYDRIFSMKARVFILLDDSMLKNTIDFNFFKSHYEEICRIPSNRELSQSGINETFHKAYLCKCIGVKLFFSLVYPDLYTCDELNYIDSVLSSLDDINEYKRNFEQFENILNERILEEYNNIREYRETAINNSISHFYEKYDSEIDNESLCSYYKMLYVCNAIVENNKEEYKLWKRKSLLIKYILKYFKAEVSFFIMYDDYIDNNQLYHFFNTLNIPLAFDKTQIEYIREMAPKLQISSYLNKEYAKYKKWHNPDARDFDFGEDEAEEEATVISKDHLERLSHFKEEKLTNLLEKLKENQYIAENTRPKDWLFAFGMSGDEKPEYFQKIQWIGRSNRGISPTYFTDFIGILGYDLNKIYFEKPKITISILNSCFMTTDKAIDQNSFNRDKDKDEFMPTVKHKKLAKLVKECGLLTE